jgi:predicted metallopeptidase
VSGLSDNEQTETIIHEIMHIPKNFGGGFRYHDHVAAKSVKGMLEKYLRAKR